MRLFKFRVVASRSTSKLTFSASYLFYPAAAATKPSPRLVSEQSVFVVTS